MRLDLLAALAALSLLAGCGSSGGGPVQSASAAAPVRKPYLSSVRKPSRNMPPPVRIQSVPGLESVIGATAADLTRQFGPARLDVWEGDAHKLQFSGNPCVLDIFLYPAAPGREPQATYVDARRASDGKDVDRVGCATALRLPTATPPPPPR